LGHRESSEGNDHAAAIRARAPARKSTNDNLAADAVTKAREPSGNASQAAEASITGDAVRLRQEGWLSENQDALASSNVFVERRGLPLARYRNF